MNSEPDAFAETPAALVETRGAAGPGGAPVRGLVHGRPESAR